ncbi:MAG: hypothetical protein ACRELS_00480 [Candidatus Rokuibacteriota bacterium]
MSAPRRLVISICPREPGRVVLAVERGGRARRLNAVGVARELTALVERRGLAERVTIREACAGGCGGPGPNVSLTIHPVPAPGERGDGVAIGWRSYVAALASLDCLARVIDENLPRPTRAAPSRPRRRRPRY